jgi:hypothetical protein
MGFWMANKFPRRVVATIFAVMSMVLVLRGAVAQTELQNDPEEIRKAKEAIKERLGDVKVKVEESNGALVYTYEYVPPKADESGARGYSALERTYVTLAWVGLQTILHEYCNFKRKNENYTKQIFEKQRPAELFTKGGIDPAVGPPAPCSPSQLRVCQRDASAPDITLTVPFIDQIMRLMVSSRDITSQSFDCKSIFDMEGKNMPDSAEMPQTQSFDDCKSAPKQCFRNKVLYNAARIVALSKTLHTAKFDVALLEGLNTKMLDQAQLELLVAKALRGVDIDTAIEENKEMWIQFSNWLGKVAQGQASGSVFRPAGGQAPSQQ